MRRLMLFTNFVRPDLLIFTDVRKSDFSDSPREGMSFMIRKKWQGVIHEYLPLLPISANTPIVTLYEGGTPLVRAFRIEQRLGIVARVYLKLEGMNPTGSFKDRGMTLAITKAVEKGVKAVICASTGNTAASAAAYAAKARLRCVVLIPKGKIAKGKLAQAVVHDAKVVEVNGSFDQALDLVREICKVKPIQLVNSINQYRIEGQKTAAFEIVDVLGRAPDYHFIPVGNAGNITAYWKGYKEYQFGGMTILPRMMGFQADGAAPIVRRMPIKNPETIATAIRIGNPALWRDAEKARDESDGEIDMVSDDEILAAYRLLAQLEGVFCEPASAASVAGLSKVAKRKRFTSDQIIVCTLTGHGLKDPDIAVSQRQKLVKISPDIRQLQEAIEG